MYYENRKEKLKEKIIIYFFMTVIIILLIVLVIRLDGGDTKTQTGSNYGAEKLSATVTEENNNPNKYNVIEKAVKSVVGISKLQQMGNAVFLDDAEKKLGLGSGIIITENGYILTNQHVAGNKYSNCYVTLENGETFSGTVVWEDSNIDLAIVKINTVNLEYMRIADSDNVHLGEDVYAIGNPIGFEFQRTVTKGIISGVNRTIKIDDQKSAYMEDLIQTDATINEGNSGGALINTNGELIGVNSVKISSAESIGFAVPVGIVKPIIEKLIETDRFDEAYLGIYGYDKEVIPYLDRTLQISSGVYVASILPDGSIKGGEIVEGDIITAIDNVRIDKMNDLKKYVYTKKPGDEVILTIKRKISEFTVKIKLQGKI